jgi:hypothetical protein
MGPMAIEDAALPKRLTYSELRRWGPDFIEDWQFGHQRNVFQAVVAGGWLVRDGGPKDQHCDGSLIGVERTPAPRRVNDVIDPLDSLNQVPLVLPSAFQVYLRVVANVRCVRDVEGW